MSVTAVVCAGYPERRLNVPRIVGDLMDGTVQPDKVIVLDNGAGVEDLLPHDVRYISGENWECRGKYVVGLLAYADFYLLNDDDMTVGPRTLETLLATAVAGSNYVTANRAVQLPPSRKLSEGVVFDADSISQPTHADVIYGSSAFMTHRALLSMLALEDELRHKWPVEGDDILAGLANDVLIQPMHGEAAFRWLPECGVSMQGRPDYWTMRDEFTLDVLEALRR